MTTGVDAVKELRERTGAGIMDCKAALKETGGDIEKSIDFLRKKGMASAAKRAGRDAKEGLIVIHVEGSKAAIAEVNCETDFVARNPEFKRLAHDITMQIAAMGPADVAALLEQPFIKDQNKKISDLINEASGRFGENIKIERFERYDA